MLDEILQFLSEINWLLILGTCITGGVLAYIGDRVGMKYAKKRISIFGLRPRYTSSLVTGVTGMLISFGAIAIMASVSNTVRTALFQMKFVQSQVVALTAELQSTRQEQELSSLLAVERQEKLDATEKALEDLKNQSKDLTDQIEPLRKERESLVAETAKLRGDLNSMRQTLDRFQEGRIIASAGEQLGQIVVPEGTATAEGVKQLIDKLYEEIRYDLARRGGVTPDTVELKADEAAIQRIIDRCLRIDSRKVIRVSSEVNILAGEPVNPDYRVFESALVFSRGEELIRRPTLKKLSAADAEVFLSQLLRDVNRRASLSGVLNDPLTGMVGDISATDFFSAVEVLKDIDGPAVVVVQAERDIYSEGPVRVKIRAEKVGEAES